MSLKRTTVPAAPRPDRKADLLADVMWAAAARPLPASPPPLPVDLGPAPMPPTPLLEVKVTPLRWSLPMVEAPDAGIGLSVRLGPVKVSLAFG